MGNNRQCHRWRRSSRGYPPIAGQLFADMCAKSFFAARGRLQRAGRVTVLNKLAEWGPGIAGLPPNATAVTGGRHRLVGKVFGPDPICRGTVGRESRIASDRLRHTRNAAAMESCTRSSIDRAQSLADRMRVVIFAA